MKLAIVLIFCLNLINSLADVSSDSPSQTSNLSSFVSQLQQCSTRQLNIVYTAINNCEVSDISITVECISKAITNNYNQEWNIFAKNTVTNPDVVMFWRYNNCFIKVNNFGRFNRTYIAWQTETYLNGTEERRKYLLEKNKLQSSSQKYKSQKSKTLLQNQPNPTCPQWKTIQVETIIQACDISGNDQAAHCIMTKIRDEMGEFWNSYVSTTFQSDMIYYQYSGCIVKFTSIDPYNRSYKLWKSH